jgi:RNA polymerase sigma-70 factor (ECF subfamily)
MIFQSPEEKFQQLYKEYLPMVRAVLYNMTGQLNLEDLTQDSFLKVWRGLPKFDFRSSVKTWIYRVTVNVAIDHLRKAPFQNHSKLEDIENSIATPEASSDNQKILQATLLEMDTEDRSLLVLFYFEDLKIEEISQVLSLPGGTVKSRLFAARNQLRDRLQKKGVSL